jgi:hypothetical protein
MFGVNDGANGNDQMAQGRSTATAAMVDSRADKKPVVACSGTANTYTFKRLVTAHIPDGTRRERRQDCRTRASNGTSALRTAAEACAVQRAPSPERACAEGL